MLLAGKVAVVTGGSRGIGRACAEGLLREGARVAVASRTSAEVDASVRAFKEAFGAGKALGSAVDVSVPSSVRAFADRVLAAFGTIDILVNAAGIQPPIGPLADVSEDEWTRSVAVNLFGTMSCSKAVLPIMMKKNAGKIINFSGGGATSPRPRFSAYACSKTAVVRLTEVLAEEVRPFHIDVNAIAPGAVNTAMLDEVLEAREKAGKEWEEAVRRKKAGGTPPEAAAHLAAFLASDESNGITGKLISAPFDPWKEEGFRDALRKERDLATLRRIDGTYFKPGVS